MSKLALSVSIIYKFSLLPMIIEPRLPSERNLRICFFITSLASLCACCHPLPPPMYFISLYSIFFLLILFFRYPAFVIIFRVGEGRAYWSLGNAYTALNRHDIALGYAEKHLIVSKEVSQHEISGKFFVRRK